jgi:hypothetical protein
VVSLVERKCYQCTAAAALNVWYKNVTYYLGATSHRPMASAAGAAQVIIAAARVCWVLQRIYPANADLICCVAATSKAGLNESGACAAGD